MHNNGGDVQARDIGLNNHWNDSLREGNFWLDYNSRYPTAQNNSRVWNTPYNIDGNENAKDHYPLCSLPTERIPPTLEYDNTSSSPTTGNEFIFMVNITDNTFVARVNLIYYYDEYNYYNISMVNISSKTWTHTIIVSNNKTILHYYFFAIDVVGNQLVTPIKSYHIIDDERPIFLHEITDNLATTDDNFTIYAYFRDNINVSNALINYTFDGYSYHSNPMSYIGGERWKSIITIASSTESVNYYFYFIDAEGNFNVTSERMIVVLDNDLPIFIVDNTSTTPTTGDVLTFSVILDDNIGIDSVYVNYTFDDIHSFKLDLLPMGNETWNGTITVPPNSTKIEYYFYFEDLAGNFNHSSVRVLAVMDNDLPYADAGPDQTVKTGEKVNLNGTGSSDNIEIVNYTWSFYYEGSTVLLYGPFQSFIFDKLDNYSITLTVVDEYENMANDSLRISVILDDSKEDDDTDDDDVDDDNDDNDDTDDDVTDDDIADDDDDTLKRDSDSRSSLPLWITIPLILVAIIIVSLILLLVLKRKRKEEPLKKEEDAPEETLPLEKEDTPEETTPEVATLHIEPPAPDIDDSPKTDSASLPPICLTCGSYSQFYPEYGRFWCGHCQQYINPEEGESQSETATHRPPENDVARDEESTEADKNGVMEELKLTREMLEKAPSFIDLTPPLKKIERAESEIENGEYEASRSIPESKNMADKIRERYRELAERSVTMLKEVPKLALLDRDTENVVELLAAGKEALMKGDFSQCDEFFEKASRSIDDAKKATVEESSTPAKADQPIESKNDEIHDETGDKTSDTATESPVENEETSEEVTEEQSEDTGDDDLKDAA